MAEKKMTRGRKTAIIAAVAFVLIMAGAAAYLSMVTIDLTPHLPRIIGMVEERVAGRTDVDRLTVKLLPSPDIRISNLETRMDGERMFGARAINLQISLLPLVIGHVNIKNMELQEAGLHVKRNAEGVLNITKFIEVTRRKLAKRLKLFSFSFNLMDITQTRVEISDLRAGEAVDFDITDIKAVVRRAPDGLVLEANANMAPDTRLSFSGKETSEGVEGKGSLRSLRLDRFGPYLRDKSPGAAITGTLDLDFVYTGTKVKEFKGTLAYDSLSLAMPELLSEKLSSRNGSAHVSLLPDTPNGPELKIGGVKLDLGSFIVNGGFMLGERDGERRYTLELSTTPIAVKELMALAGPALAGKFGGVKPLGGSVIVDRLLISRPLIKSGDKKSALSGVELTASIDGVSLAHPSLKKPLKELSGAISMKEEALKVTAAGGSYGKGRLTALDAAVTGLTGNEPSYSLSGQATLDVNETLSIASGLVKEGGPASVLLSRSSAQGEMRVRAEASGRLKAGLSGARYSATAEVIGGSFAYRGSPVKAKSINAAAEFDEKTIKNISLSATDGFSDMELTASVRDYRERDPLIGLSIKGKASADTLRSLIQGSAFEKEAAFEGDILYELKAGGTPSKATVEVALDAGQAYIQYKKFLDKPPGVRLSLDLSATKDGGNVDIKKAALRLSKVSSLSVAGSAALNLSSYDITVDADKLLLSDIALLSGYLDRGFESFGLVSFNLKTQKKSREESASYKGEAKVAGGRFMLTAFPKPVDDFSAQASFTGSAASMTLDNLSIGRTRASGRIEVSDIAHRTIDFELNSSALYTTDLLAKKEKEPVEERPAEKAPEKTPGPAIEPPGTSINGRGTIRVAEGELFGQPFKNMNADVAIGSHVARIMPISMEIDNGQLTGDIAYHMSPLSKNSFDSRFRLTGIDLDTLLRGFGVKKEYLTGSMNGTVELYGTRGAKPFYAGLGGTASLRAEGGRMWKLPVLADIFNIVNILTIDELLQKGLPYKELYGDFDMAGGVAFAKNITMNSDSMRMSAAGELNFPAGTMDMVLGIYPFVTIDKIISNIPLAGWLITGERGSTVSMYFSIKGPFKDRKVRAMPIKGIAKGVFGILQRVLEAPIDILKGEIPGEAEKKKLMPKEPRPEPAQ